MTKPTGYRLWRICRYINAMAMAMAVGRSLMLEAGKISMLTCVPASPACRASSAKLSIIRSRGQVVPVMSPPILIW